MTEKLNKILLEKESNEAVNEKRADIGDIEILEKFSFFEVEKSFKDEVLRGLQTQKFKGKEMRAEVAN